MNRYNRIMEIFWILIGVLTMGMAVYLYVQNRGGQDSAVFFIAGAMAILLSLLRRFYRKRNETHKD